MWHFFVCPSVLDPLTLQHPFFWKFSMALNPQLDSDLQCQDDFDAPQLMNYTNDRDKRSGFWVPWGFVFFGTFWEVSPRSNIKWQATHLNELNHSSMVKPKCWTEEWHNPHCSIWEDLVRKFSNFMILSESQFLFLLAKMTQEDHKRLEEHSGRWPENNWKPWKPGMIYWRW